MSALERLGLATLAAWTVWVLAASMLPSGTVSEAWFHLVAPFTVVAGMVLGSRVLARSEPLHLCLGLLFVAGAALTSVAFRGGSGGGALGYSNANAALGTQLAALSAVAALRLRGREQALALLAAIVAATSTVASFSRAGVVLLIPLVVATLLALARSVRRRRWPAPLAAVAVVAAAAAVTTLATRSQWPHLATAVFDETRKQLWSDALVLWQASPLTGSGPGSFRGYTGLAVDPDTVRAHMSVLQVGSELGWVGVALFAAMVALLLIRVVGARPGEGLIATTALTVLLMHSFVDHLLEFPAITLTTGAVIGLATAQSDSAGALRPDGRGTST